MTTRPSKDAREPDIFLKTMNNLLRELKPYSKQIFVLCILLLVLAVGVAGLNFYKENQEVAAQEQYIGVERAYNKVVQDFEGAQNKIKSAETEIERIKKDKTKKADSGKLIEEKQKEIADAKGKLPSGSFEKDYGKFVGEFQKVIKDHPKTQAAAMASLYLTKLYADQKKISEGIALLNSPDLSLREGHLMFGLVKMRLGQLYEQNGECQKSIDTWSQVLQTKELSFLHPEASLATAVCYENIKNFDKAKEFYKKTSVEFKNSPAGETAEKYQRLLNIKKDEKS